MPPVEELDAVEVILAVLELLALLNASNLVLSTEQVATRSAREVLEALLSLSASGTRTVCLSDVLRVQLTAVDACEVDNTPVDSSLYAAP